MFSLDKIQTHSAITFDDVSGTLFIKEMLKSGYFGKTFSGILFPSKERYNIQFNDSMNMNYNVYCNLLSKDKLFLKFNLNEAIPFLLAKSVGKLNNCYYVLTEDCKFKLGNRDSFKKNDIYNIVICILKGLEYLSLHNVAHGNLCFDTIGLKKNDCNNAYIFEFYYSKDHSLCQDMDNEDCCNLVGSSLNFISNDSHEGLSASYRGDLNSLIYLIYKMNFGKLPWELETIETDIMMQKYIFMSENIDKCDNSLGLQIIDKNLKELKYHEKPNFFKIIEFYQKNNNKKNFLMQKQIPTLCDMLNEMNIIKSTSNLNIKFINIHENAHTLAKILLDQSFSKFAIRNKYTDFNSIVWYAGEKIDGEPFNGEILLRYNISQEIALSKGLVEVISNINEKRFIIFTNNVIFFETMKDFEKMAKNNFNGFYFGENMDIMNSLKKLLFDKEIQIAYTIENMCFPEKFNNIK
uniref:Protein kinase domain-containing protein n=1 Tax=Strongyloides stercoralis TaxID=6248 RepID=A0A0K0EBY6_STRER